MEGSEKSGDASFLTVKSDTPQGSSACKFCGSIIKLSKNRRRHEKTCRLNTGEELPPPVVCPRCSQVFTRKDNLKAHMKNPCQIYSRIACHISNCGMKFFSKKQLLEHLQRTHVSDGITIAEPVALEFKQRSDFLKWKADEEEKTSSHFTKQRGEKKKSVERYYCQRDGPQRRPPARRPIRRGRVKIGMTCIAQMKVVSAADGSVNVDYFPTHSHVCPPSNQVHQPRATSTKAEQLVLEVSQSKVRRRVTKKVVPDELSPDVPTKSAMPLALQRIGARDGKLDEDEAQAVYLLAQRLEAEDTLVIFKPTNSGMVKGPEETFGLEEKEDLFLLGIQTPQQQQLMIEHCGRIIVVDVTQGTNHHDYKLLTLLVVDDQNEGWPVAHLITSHSDEISLSLFFSFLKARLPHHFEINCVITDDDSAVINAINMGFQCTVRHFLCLWHVQKAWKAYLRKKGLDKELMETMSFELSTIAWEPDESSFYKLTRAFIKKYSQTEQTRSFVEYFCKFYMNRTDKWAMSCRHFSHGEVETSGHVESFQTKLRTNLKPKKIKRIDDLVSTLLQIAEDDHTERYQQVVQPSELHRRGVSLSDEMVEQIDDSVWLVSPSLPSTEPYLVRRYADCCLSPDHCSFVCVHPSCGALCSHMFSCNCPDEDLLCEHIHKVQSLVVRDSLRESQLVKCGASTSRYDSLVSDCVERMERLTAVIKGGKGTEAFVSYCLEMLKQMEAQLAASTSTLGTPFHLERMEPTTKVSSNEVIKTQKVVKVVKSSKRRKILTPPSKPEIYYLFEDEMSD